tara:strand:+ start:253 stop:408 length:156 start_codon:yes stop_codon:yes gene_type:complete
MTSIEIAGHLRHPYQFVRKGELINLHYYYLAAQAPFDLVERPILPLPCSKT